MTELSQKVAIVIGAKRKRGLGRAIALARACADLVVTGSDRQPPSLTADEEKEGWRGVVDVAQEITSLGVRSHAVFVDVRKSHDVELLMRETVQRMGCIDILVNSATYPRAGDRVALQELDDALWRTVIEVNLTGSMLCAKYAAKQMITQGEGGSIVSISSGSALKAPATFAAYAASKAGIHALTSSLADELGPHGITANVVAPGFLDMAQRRSALPRAMREATIHHSYKTP